MTNNTIPMLVNGKSLEPLILTNNWSFRTNILNITLDRNLPYIYDIVMGTRSVSPTTLIHVLYFKLTEIECTSYKIIYFMQKGIYFVF